MAWMARGSRTDSHKKPAGRRAKAGGRRLFATPAKRGYAGPWTGADVIPCPYPLPGGRVPWFPLQRERRCRRSAT